MSLVSYHFSTLQYIRRLYNNHQGCLTRCSAATPSSNRRKWWTKSFRPAQDIHMNSLKVGKLHILRLFPPGHLLYLTKRCWLGLTPTQSLNYEFYTLTRMVAYEELLFPLKATAILLCFTSRQNYTATTAVGIVFWLGDSCRPYT